MGPGEIEARMRPYEAGSDRAAAPGSFVVVRLEGRGFGRLLRGRHELDRPLDVRVRDILIATADHLMNGALPVVFGHTHSDEITLLLGREAGARPWLASAALAGEASARCTLLLGALASFGARVAELPDAAQVVAYFAGRQAAAVAAALQVHCAWELQQRGASEADARARVEAAAEDGASGVAALAGALGVAAEALPDWQTRGVALVWERPEPIQARTGAPVVLRRRVRVLLELAAGEDYAALVRAQAERAAAPEL